MSFQFQTALQAAFGFLLIGSLPSLVFADSWGARTDIGVAAIDRKTGQVRWEAWQRDDVPNDISKAGKVAVENFLTDDKRNQESNWPDLPAALANDRVIDHVHEESGSYFILSHGQPDAIGAEIARFSFEDNARWRSKLAGGTLYCLREAQVQVFLGTIKGDPKDKQWEPSWTFNLLDDVPEQEREIAKLMPMDLHVNAEGVWVVHGPRILQLTPEGRLQGQYKLKRLSMTWFDHHVGTPLTFGERLIYYRSTQEVIALDWQKKRELWRVSTELSPNISRVVEIGENLVLAQIGSNVPQTIESALVAKRHPLPQLGSNTTKQRIAAARLLHSYGDGYLRKQLREYLEQLRKSESDLEAKKAATVLENLLATWPRKRDRQRLIDACVSALLHAEDKDVDRVFASPARQRMLTWCLLQGLIYGVVTDQPGFNYAYHSWHENRLSLATEEAAKLADHCRHILATGPEAEKSYAASVLVSRAIGWFRLTDAERKKLFLSQHPSIWRWTAMSLVKNGWRDEVIQWAPKRPAADHLDIIWILAHRIPKEWPKAELDFWLTCARRTPGSIACVLDREIEGEIPVVFRTPIRSYLEKEITNPTVKDIDNEEAGNLFAAVYVLDRWKNPDDTPLLLRYLKHPYIRLRGHVKGMLEKRDVKVPPDIVYEEGVEQGKE